MALNESVTVCSYCVCVVIDAVHNTNNTAATARKCVMIIVCILSVDRKIFASKNRSTHRVSNELRCSLLL